jgi:hypothetical protein
MGILPRTRSCRECAPKFYRLAGWAALCVTLFLIFEAAHELARPSSTATTAPPPLTTHQQPDKTYADHLRGIAAKLPWASQEPDSLYIYKSLGSEGEQFPSNERAKVGKCTLLFGNHEYAYHAALDTHVKHNQLHHYPAYILDRSIQDDMWSKQAAVLEVLLLEMEKPAKDRLQWLAWFDADTMNINPLVPLETFLPPPDMPGVHALFARDWNGLNAGTFMIRISTWSIEFMSAVLAYRVYNPDANLPWGEQTAMKNLLDEDDFKTGAVYVPARWFNAYPDGDPPYKAQPGDIGVHFAGVGNKGVVMEEWLYQLEKDRAEWAVPLDRSNLTSQVKWFWDGVRMELHGE